MAGWVSSSAMSYAERTTDPRGVIAADGRVGLRPFCVADAGAHLSGCDELIIQRLGGGEPSTLAQVEEWLTANAEAWATGHPVVDVGIVDLASSTLCGCVGIQRGLDVLTEGQVNLSYALYPAWRGRGYATRAVRLAMAVALESQPVVEFVIRAAPDNTESLAVAERAGFTRSEVTSDQHGELVWRSFRPGQHGPGG